MNKVKIMTKMRIRLESFNKTLIVSSCQKINNIIQNISTDSISIVSLPIKKRIYCVLRSPHVDKDSREHFEIRIYKRILDIYSPKSEPDILKLLEKANISCSVVYSYRVKN